MQTAGNLDDTGDPEARRWYPLALVALTVLAWANAFSCAFIFDDKTMIVGNPRLHHLWPPWQAVTVPTRWLVDLTFALNHAFGGFNPADFHLTNLLIHLVAGLLLYGVIRRTLETSPVCAGFEPRSAGLAFLVSAAWLVHPVQTESVTYVVQRAEALMGLLFLSVFYAFIRSLTAPRPVRWRGLAWALCLLGMGTKEVMVATPFLLFLFDATFVADSWRAVFRSRGRFHAAMLATLAGFAALLVCGIVRAWDDGGLFYGESLRWRYLLTQSQAILHYLRLSVAPWPLCLDYRWPLVATWREVAWQAPLVSIALVCGLAGAWRRRSWAFLVTTFFVILAPTSSLMPLPDAVFEHRLYLPLAAVLILIILGGDALLGWIRHGVNRALRIAATAALAMLVCGFAALTSLRNADYHDEETMWRDTIIKRPDNFRAYVGLATALMAANRGAEALTVSRTALDRLPRFAAVPADEIERHWRAQPGMPVAEYAMVCHNAGAACLVLDRNTEALRYFREAARVLPRVPWIHASVAHVLFAQGRIDDAIAAWRISLALNPRAQRVQTALAVALATQGHDREAVEHYREALRLDPDDAFVRAQLAWTLATHAGVCDGQQAVAMAEPLAALAQGRSVRALDILAAAYAAAGRPADAVRTAEEALALDRRQCLDSRPSDNARKAAALSDAIRDRLALYRNGHPFHESITNAPPREAASR